MENRKIKTFPTFSLVVACEQALLSGDILRGHARVIRERRRDVLAHMIDFSCLLLLFYFCSAGLPRVAEIFSRVQRLSLSEMLRGRSDTSSNLKPRFCFRGEAFLKEKRKEIEWMGGRDGDRFKILI